MDKSNQHPIAFLPLFVLPDGTVQEAEANEYWFAELLRSDRTDGP